MTGNASIPARQAVVRAIGNREFVRHLLRTRQPRFAGALESAVQDLLQEGGTSDSGSRDS
jgi:hypothetical protein